MRWRRDTLMIVFVDLQAERYAIRSASVFVCRRFTLRRTRLDSTASLQSQPTVGLPRRFVTFFNAAVSSSIAVLQSRSCFA